MLIDVLNGNLQAIEKAITEDKASMHKRNAREGEDYYKGEHEIKNYRLFYYDSNGVLKEDKYKSNIKIRHQFHTELVDQKVQYLLSNPVEVNTTDETLQEYLKEYINEDFQVLLHNLVEGASNKGQEYAYAYLDVDNRVRFQIANSLGVIPIYNDMDILEGILRYYINEERNSQDKIVNVTKVEIWTSEDVTYYTQNKDTLVYELDKTKPVNPKPHILLEDEKYFYNGGSLGYIPYFRLDNNRYKTTDLEPIKNLIDDYDLMACSLSNNLQDFQEAIYVVRGYNGDNLDKLTTNLKTKKTIGVDSEGGIDVKTIEIPVEARKTKLALDKEGIYKFGMGFDSSQVGDGNITNVVIKSRYALLDMKCKKIKPHLNRLIRNLLEVIIDNINKLNGTAYNFRDLEIKITESTLVNEDALVDNEKTKADTQTAYINNVLLTNTILSNDTKLKLICAILELDYEEEKQALENQEPYVDLDGITEGLINKANSQEGDVVE